MCYFKMSFHRLNFTLENLDVSCPAYNYFGQCLTELCQQNQERKKFVVEEVNTSSLPQYFQYNRIKYLVHCPFSVTVFIHEIILFLLIDRIMFSSQELWKITSHPNDKGWQRVQNKNQKKQLSTFNFYWHAYFIIAPV